MANELLLAAATLLVRIALDGDRESGDSKTISAVIDVDIAALRDVAQQAGFDKGFYSVRVELFQS